MPCIEVDREPLAHLDNMGFTRLLKHPHVCVIYSAQKQGWLGFVR